MNIFVYLFIQDGDPKAYYTERDDDAATVLSSHVSNSFLRR